VGRVGRVGRDGGGALVALAILCILAWLYLLRLAGPSDLAVLDLPVMPMTGTWDAADAAAMFVMWAVMMVAMMLPSATPVVLLYDRTLRRRPHVSWPTLSVLLFVAGYVVAWAGFSVVATVCNWVLHRGGWLTSMMGSAAPRVGGALLIAAGLYQLTPFKDACLVRCRSPVGFLADHWREGRFGALSMGVHHGLYCVGCCWLLMALLFVLGVMNLVWIVALTVFVLIEKVAPWGRLANRLSAALLVVWGGWLLLAP
jgi:predicted metal-binding membrane protein